MGGEEGLTGQGEVLGVRNWGERQGKEKAWLSGAGQKRKEHQGNVLGAHLGR